MGMATVIQANALAFILVLAIGLLVAWWLWGRGRADRRERHRAPDALDEGAGPARRNQALIDSPSAAARHTSAQTEAARIAAPLAGTGPDIFGGIGEVLAAAAASEAAAAKEAKKTEEVPPADQPAAEAPEPAAALAPAAPTAGSDDLTRIKGLGPKLKARLAELGVTSFAQIAAWTEADIAALDAQLGAFAGRATRDKWVEQASFLASGDLAGYEAKFGKL